MLVFWVVGARALPRGVHDRQADRVLQALLFESAWCGCAGTRVKGDEVVGRGCYERQRARARGAQTPELAGSALFCTPPHAHAACLAFMFLTARQRLAQGHAIATYRW